MAEAESPKRNKRRLRPASQTVRERAEQAQQTADEPSRRALRVKNATDNAKKPFRRFAKLFHRQPFRFIGKILGFIGRIIVPRYFRESWSELKLVTWPNRTQSRRLTTAVLIFAIIFGALVATLDWGLDKLFKAILLK